MRINYILFFKHKYSQAQRLNVFSFILLHKAKEDGKQPVTVYVRWSNLTHVVILNFFKK